MRFSKLFLTSYYPWGLNFVRLARPCCQKPANPPPDQSKVNHCLQLCQLLQLKKYCNTSRVEAIGLVLGVFEENGKYELTETAAAVDQAADGKISKYLSELSPQMKLGKAFTVTDVGEYRAVALASVGPKDAGYNKLEELDEKAENVRWGVGAGVQELQARGCGLIEVDTCGQPEAAGEAAELAAWRFQEFRSEKEPPVSLSAGPRADAAWEAGRALGAAQNWARLLADMPANTMTPTLLAQAALDVLCPLGVEVEARDREWITTQDMRAFLAVAQGSCEEPYFLECHYKGAGDNSPVVLLVGKGVTFDCGGLCLKPTARMVENRGSMAGAAVVLAALHALATLKVPINVRACLPLCENMISGQCMKVGDVVRALNGIHIQIEDTDMEGRLMMADALIYGQAMYKPALVIDVATLTRGVRLATGAGAFGCFSNCEHAWGVMRAAGARSGDRPWRFPLWQYYHKQIVDEPAVDLRNKGSGMATACLGAAFLRRFVCGKWVHVDVAGVGKLAHEAPPYLRPHRMSGRPARTLAAALQHLARQDSCQAGPTTSQDQGPQCQASPTTRYDQGPAPCQASPTTR